MSLGVTSVIALKAALALLARGSVAHAASMERVHHSRICRSAPTMAAVTEAPGVVPAMRHGMARIAAGEHAHQIAPITAGVTRCVALVFVTKAGVDPCVNGAP